MAHLAWDGLPSGEPLRGFLPRIGVRGRLCAGITMALRRPHKGDENVVAPSHRRRSESKGRGWVPAPASAGAGSARERRKWGRGTAIFMVTTHAGCGRRAK